MKFKKSTIKTREGLSLANYSDGWSMEYGEGGSYSVDILLNGKKVANVIEEGNGGPVMIYYEAGADRKELGDKVLTFLKRTNKHYRPDSAYDFCKNATSASDTEYATFVNDMLDVIEFNKRAKTAFKKGYKSVLEINTGYESHTIKGGKPFDYEGLVDYAKTRGIRVDNAEKIHFLSEGGEITTI